MLDAGVRLFERASGSELHRDPTTKKCQLLTMGKWSKWKQDQSPLGYLAVVEELNFLGVKLARTIARSRAPNGEQFIIPVPVPKVWEWAEPFPFLFPNVQKSFPLTPGGRGVLSQFWQCQDFGSACHCTPPRTENIHAFVTFWLWTVSLRVHLLIRKPSQHLIAEFVLTN